MKTSSAEFARRRDVFVSRMANLYLPKLFDELQKYVIVHAHNKTAIMVAELATPIAFHWNESIGLNRYMHEETGRIFDVRVFNPNAWPSLSGPFTVILKQGCIEPPGAARGNATSVLVV